MQILPDDYIQSESYIEFDDEVYLAKNLRKIKSGGQHYYDVTLYHNMVELSDLTIDRFSLIDSVTNLVSTILSDSGWIKGTVDIDENISLVFDKRVSLLEALTTLAEKCGGELYFYSKTRVIDLKRQIGTVTGLQLRYDKNCDYIEKEEDSSDLVTRIYPYGPDNYTINTTVISDCEDDGTTWTKTAGASIAATKTIKQNGSQGLELTAVALNDTFYYDLGLSTTKDLSDHTTLKFWIYSATANASGFTFGIGEAAWDNYTTTTGALSAGCWKEITYDISAITNSAKNAIRYFGFKSLASSAVVVVDNIRAFNGTEYIDSPNIDLYKFRKEFVFNHSAKVEKTQNETLIYPTQDAYVYQDKKNTNYGTATTLKIRDYGSVDFISFIKFALTDIPTGATITEAYIDTYITATDFSASTGCDIKRANADWDENTLTWNNKPDPTGGSITTFECNAVGWVETDITTTVQNWWSGATDNFGVMFELNITDTNKTATISSKEGTYKPYLRVVYTVDNSPQPIIEEAAREYLNAHDEPILTYKVKCADLSEVLPDWWEDETINLGDTVRVYDSDLGINVDCRVKKITKDILDPANINIELTNKVTTIVDIEALLIKQLKSAMPFEDNHKIVNANAVQVGKLGDVT